MNVVAIVAILAATITLIAITVHSPPAREDQRHLKHLEDLQTSTAQLQSSIRALHDSTDSRWKRMDRFQHRLESLLKPGSALKLHPVTAATATKEIAVEVEQIDKLVTGDSNKPQVAAHRPIRVFTEIALRTGTDKVSKDHEYGAPYQRWLGGVQDEKFAMIEIGFAGGKSAAAWEEFLPNAEIHEIEIACKPDRNEKWVTSTPLFKKWSAAGRVHCQSVTEWDKTAAILESLKSPLQLVIDDGGHSPTEMGLTFLYFFPRLAPGGIFVMEDIAAAWHNKQQFVWSIVKPLMDDVQRDTRWPNTIKHPPKLPSIAPLLRSVSCYQGLCVIERNDAPATTPPIPTWPPNV